MEEATECDMPGLATGYYRIRTGMTYINDNQVRVKYMMSNKQSGKYWAIWGTPTDFDEETQEIRPLFKITNMGDETYDIFSPMYETRFTDAAKSVAEEMTTESTNLMAIDEAGTLDDVTYYNIRVSTQQPQNYSYLHTDGHSSGKGRRGNIVGWISTFNTTTVGASEWLFEKVDDSEAEAIIDAWQPYLEQEKALQTYRAIYAQAKQEIEATKEMVKLPLVTDITQLTSPCSDASEGVGEHGLQALIDGITGADDSNNFWHSDWHNKFTTETHHYLQVELTKTLTKPVLMQFSRRGGAINDHVTKWSVYGTDVNDFELTQASGQLELLAEFDTPCKSNTETIQTDYFDTKGYKYLRFYCEEGTRGKNFFHLSEFNVYLTEQNSDSQYALIGQPASNLDRIITSQKNLADDDVTQADIDEFTNAYNAFLAAKPQLGDLDCDGQIDADDVRFLTNVIIIPHVAFKPSADLNGDSRISIADLTELIRLLRK